MTKIMIDHDIEFFNEIDSTNNEAKRRIEVGTEPVRPLIIAARSQTAGRGRQGKNFFSPKGTGIYLTAVCPMNCPIDGQVTVTSKTAVAVSRAIEGFFGIGCKIKWVNDIYVNDRKCCGILCEAVNDYENNRLRYVIIGVGVNVYPSDWPDDIANIAGSVMSFNGKLSEEKFTGFAERISQEILHVIYEADGNEMDYYRERSYVIGREIVFYEHAGDQTQQIAQTALAAGIDEKGGLIVELPSGERRTLDSGEITVRRVEGNEKRRDHR
ncbi:MAG: biotin--[acetyl-CoA-carboxylase] ligase [Lachnospiraceae bacterium]|nr:biotin--[acetyl-CoA-carboxylase] ligase [Lachnospiraceae bacterium]